MSPIIQTCVVIVTIAVVAVSYYAVRLMMRLDKAADAIQDSVNRSREEISSLVSYVHKVAAPLQRTTERLEMVGNRLADISDNVLDEVESPVRAVSAITRGLRAGTSEFVGRLTQRFAHRH